MAAFGLGRPVRRQGGQALIEFGMVAPVIFALFFGFISIALWTVEKQFIAHAVTEGAVAGNYEVSRIVRLFAQDERLVQPYLNGLNNAVFSSTVPCSGGPCALDRLTPTGQSGFTCQRHVLNATPGKRAWDAECLYMASGTKVSDSWSIWYPLASAVRGAAAADAALPTFLRSDVTWRACYLFVTPPSAIADEAQCVSLSSAGVMSSFMGSGSGNYAGQAPSFISVSSTSSVFQLFGTAILAIRAANTQVLDRFLPSCSASITACRAIY